MPRNSLDGLNPIHCWQHSLAVAQISEHLSTLHARADASTAYLAGLCHDLGELVFREISACFAKISIFSLGLLGIFRHRLGGSAWTSRLSL